jgi:hypothetical protein
MTNIGPHTVFLDLSRVEYVSSEGLGKLLRLHKRVQAAGGRLSLCNVHGLLEVFEVPGLHNLLDVHRDDDEAGRRETVPLFRLKPETPILDGAAVTELENLYDIWWNSRRSAGD